MKTLTSYVLGGWVPGDGPGATLYNPATEEALATTSTEGIDFAAALSWSRETGGAAMRAMSFAERGAMLERMAQVLRDAREELLSISVDNGGNTRGDAKFDVDGASFTLATYARLGGKLGDTALLVDGDGVQLGGSPRYHGQHVVTSRHGAAVHINAFNFPAWGLAEKAAVALLAGMPIVAKPATATALLAHRMTELWVEAEVLPVGALSLLCGGVGDLLDHLDGQDVLAFTGSGDTAALLRGLEPVVRRSVRVNIEADSLNAAVLGLDVAPGDDTWHMFLGDVARDITQKAGQKCTAIRRILVPDERVAQVCEALGERLADVRVGNPAERGVRMGPLATTRQLDDVRAGIDQLSSQTEPAYGGTGEVTPVGVPEGKGYFVGPVLRRAADAASAPIVHEHEVFGPVATVIPYSGDAAEAAEIVRRGAGGLVSSVYSDDRGFLGDMVLGIAAFHGRLYLGSAKITGMSAGPGTVLPTMAHGGPGRAGGGEELGGLRGLGPYMQRTALQGDQAIIKRLVEGGARIG